MVKYHLSLHRPCTWGNQDQKLDHRSACPPSSRYARSWHRSAV